MKIERKQAKLLSVPAPAHHAGYTRAEIESFMSEDQLQKFNDWHEDQTRAYLPGIGEVIYTCDVENFLRMVRSKDSNSVDYGE